MKRIRNENINTKEYWDNVHKSGQMVEGDDWLKNSVITNHIIDDSRVLEIGCGLGWLLSRIATEKPYCRLVGVEFTDSAIEKLKQDRRIDAVKADITQDDFLPNEQESFDYVICSEVLEHLEDPAKLVKEMSRLLVKGGMAIITTPYRDCVPSLEHIWEFDVADIKNMMDGCFSQCWVYPWASGSSVYEVADGCGRILYPPGELNVIWGIGVK